MSKDDLPGAAPLRVLIVDDGADTVDVMVLLLEMDGFSVRGTHLPVQALAIAQDFRPDVLITDMHMPSLTGAELSAQLRAALPGLQSWVATGEPLPTMQPFLDSGVFDRLLPKPLEMDAIAQQLRDLRLSGTASEGSATG